MQLCVRLSRGRAAYGSGSHRALSAEGELTGKQLVRSPFVHHQHDQVRLRAANLEAHAAALNADGGRRRPAVAALVPAHQISLSILPANNKGRCLKARNNYDAVSVFD